MDTCNEAIWEAGKQAFSLEAQALEAASEALSAADFLRAVDVLAPRASALLAVDIRELPASTLRI